TAAIAVVRGAACRPPPRVPRGGRAPRRGLPRVGYRAMTETPGSMSDLVAVVRRYWPVVVAAVLLVPHALMFDFVNDDAYISFRYARNLAEHGQLVFNVGERVEGFTNFLWTVLLAGGIKLGLSPVLTSRSSGIAFGVGTLAVAVRLSLRLDRDKPSRWHLVAPLGLAATGAFA